MTMHARVSPPPPACSKRCPITSLITFTTTHTHDCVSDRCVCVCRGRPAGRHYRRYWLLPGLAGLLLVEGEEGMAEAGSAAAAAHAGASGAAGGGGDIGAMEASPLPAAWVVGSEAELSALMSSLCRQGPR